MGNSRVSAALTRPGERLQQIRRPIAGAIAIASYAAQPQGTVFIAVQFIQPFPQQRREALPPTGRSQGPKTS
jgi:hypothetical protein